MPAVSPMKPKVWPWFLLYVASLVFVYTLCVVGGLIAVAYGLSSPGPDALQWTLTGGMIAGISLPLLLGIGAAPFLPRKKWVWIYDIVLIAIGMGSCLWMPLSIFLLIKFLEPEVKEYFGA